ncbi:transglycosylase domain-containing protein [Priestia abyssalis]|uniref:transglycosylase domain-containing protein n=1 Tax=Priestia abyssalis TaxID=1221450 RepID=UPI0009954584|nr:PBP1A family penicillin-binding protein [Priestia abyssalis]
MKTFATRLLLLALCLFLFTACSFQDIADINKMDVQKLLTAESTVIYDSEGNVLDTLFKTVPRTNVSLDTLPDYAKMAFVVTEDKRFYEHFGVDIRGIFRALVTNIVERRKAEGASTITQQLVRNLYLSREKTIRRKVDEMILAVALERKLTKDEILELYVNQIYFGSGTYGIGAATKLYFDKEAKDLSISEAALLAGLPKAPSKYSPANDADLAQERRNIVLDLMYEQKVISKEEWETAKEEDVHVPDVPVKESSPYQAFIDAVTEEATETYNITEEQLYRGGYKIYTGFEKTLQDAVNDTADGYRFAEDWSDQKVEIGIAAVSPETGLIQALYGGRDYTPKSLNHAVIPYQPGSAIKPLAVYAPALETNVWNRSSTLIDEPKTFSDYAPKNYNNRYHGEVLMEEAVARSLNIPAVSLLSELGVNQGFNFIKKSGIDLKEEDKNLALALGGTASGISPLQFAQAYTTFANGGIMTEARVIERFVKPDGQTKSQQNSKTLMTAENAQEMTDMLRSVVEEPYGTGRKARSTNVKIAGKTGTTQLSETNLEANKDAWFVGYTEDTVMAVHAGFDRPDDDHYLKSSGGDAPAIMFGNIIDRWE